MSRKNNGVVVVLFVLVSLMSLALTACDGDSNSCTPKPGEANCVSQGKPLNTTISPTAEPVKVKVDKAVDKVKKTVETEVDKSLDQTKNDPKNPFGAAGRAVDEQSCKNQGGTWYAVDKECYIPVK